MSQNPVNPLLDYTCEMAAKQTDEVIKDSERLRPDEVEYLGYAKRHIIDAVSQGRYHVNLKVNVSDKIRTSMILKSLTEAGYIVKLTGESFLNNNNSNIEVRWKPRY